MLEHGSLRNPILINTIGHTAGVLLFGLIVVLLIRDWRIHGMRQIKLSLIAALLALGWNVGSLIALALPSGSLAMAIVIMASFSVLSLLPAILFQVALQGQPRYMVAAGYVVSLCAVALHFGELFYPNIHVHQAALVSIVAGFGVLTVAAFCLRYKVRSKRPTEKFEWISLGCLALFTSSFLHFGYHHVSSPWSAEIAWHHIGIPVALIVLLRDYRFLLLDAFLRFLVNSGLAAIYVTAILVLNEKLRLWNLIGRSMFVMGLALVALCLSLILFAYLRNAAQWWVSRVIFRRQSVDDSVRAIVKLSVAVASEDELLTRAAEQVAHHLQTDWCAVLTVLADKARLDHPSVMPREQDMNGSAARHFRPEARIPLRFSSGDARFLIVGSRRGGRRYLSEDLEDMRQLGSAIVEQVERFRAEELKRLVSQAELRALQAQINPHFLFNALNTLYGTIDRRSQDARRMVLNLADIFRYFLQGDRTVIALSEELRIVEAYLEIEALRLGDRLETKLVISESAKSTSIPILSIQPLVENAVKHGIAAKAGRGRVCVTAEKDATGLRITVEDTGVGFDESTRQRHLSGAGIGLENVRRRLALCYGPAADLQIQSGPGGTTVAFVVPDPTRERQVTSQIEVEA